MQKSKAWLMDLVVYVLSLEKKDEQPAPPFVKKR
jgi:hypothetical protein